MADISSAYARRHHALVETAKSLENHLKDILSSTMRIDRISARAKSIDRFVQKANKKSEDGTSKYSEPLTQIQDQIGARIITFYKSDIQSISDTVQKYFRSIEAKDLIPESEWQFGYFGKHYILFIPSEVVSRKYAADLPAFFELQIKTLFQHAWSEANHDLGYKSGKRILSPDENRSLAWASAQAWGADRIFDELFTSRS